MRRADCFVSRLRRARERSETVGAAGGLGAWNARRATSAVMDGGIDMVAGVNGHSGGAQAELGRLNDADAA